MRWATSASARQRAGCFMCSRFLESPSPTGTATVRERRRGLRLSLPLPYGRGAGRVIAATAMLLAIGPLCAEERTLRVCADPDNPPFSNERREGFDNEIAALLAKALDAKLEFTWYSQRRFSLRNSVNAGLCDAVLGVPTSLDNVAVTRPYYRSSYVFVEQPGVDISSMDDSRLEKLRIGLNIAGEDYTPPGHLLARRGLAANLKGF